MRRYACGPGIHVHKDHASPKLVLLQQVQGLMGHHGLIRVGHKLIQIDALKTEENRVARHRIVLVILDSVLASVQVEAFALCGNSWVESGIKWSRPQNVSEAYCYNPDSKRVGTLCKTELNVILCQSSLTYAQHKDNIFAVLPHQLLHYYTHTHTHTQTCRYMLIVNLLNHV